MPVNVVASVGTDGVGLGYMKLWDCIMITEFDTIVPESAASLIGLITLEMKNNSESLVREIRTLGLSRRGLETGS